MSEPTDFQLDALFAAARAQRPDTSRAEYAFETRLMARLGEASRPNFFSTWTRVSWRMIPVLGLFVLGLVLWEDHVSTAAQEAQQISSIENPDASDLVASFD
jgi:hypothetical protein